MIRSPTFKNETLCNNHASISIPLRGSCTSTILTYLPIPHNYLLTLPRPQAPTTNTGPRAYPASSTNQSLHNTPRQHLHTPVYAERF